MVTLAFTPGEPAGIGPDLALRIPHLALAARVVVFADPELLAGRAHTLGIRIRLIPYDPDKSTPTGADTLEIVSHSLIKTVRCGTADPENAPYVLACLKAATDSCLQGELSALVTGPIHKAVINQAGIPFSGHTEYLASCAGGIHPVMMLAVPGLRVALATTHLPLADVSTAITRDSLEHTLRILIAELQGRFGIARPRILVCGLNPHAGEDGHMGREEIEVIRPVVKSLEKLDAELLGPLPADTSFTPERLKNTDAVLAMYHDQGLPVLKHMGFGRAVNITLGLPFIRTSVDHGTALELAGTGHFDDGSLKAALATAITMANQT